MNEPGAVYDDEPGPLGASGGLGELESWLDHNWDPALPLRRWWERLGLAGWSRPDWPVEWYGKALPAEANTTIERTIRRHGAVTGPTGFGANMGGPTLVKHGDDDQRRRHLPGMVTGVDAYCQLFSEPNAGSDLAAVQTRAERDGVTWVINGQKVWSSRAATANKALLLARTNPDVPKHAGLSYFVLDLRQPGVEVRPLREMTGRSHFNEVFLTDARVSASDLIGGLGNGWAVALSTLAFERALSGGAGDALNAPEPGELAGNLDRPAGDFAYTSRTADGTKRSTFDNLLDSARALGRLNDPATRQNLAKLYTLERLNLLTDHRARALQASGHDLPGIANLSKMAQTHTARLGQDLTFAILGPHGLLHSYDTNTAGITDLPQLIHDALWAQAMSIYGGTDQIQRNIVSERVLGLPREPHPTPSK